MHGSKPQSSASAVTRGGTLIKVPSNDPFTTGFDELFGCN
jgi:hypothetical protein